MFYFHIKMLISGPVIATLRILENDWFCHQEKIYLKNRKCNKSKSKILPLNWNRINKFENPKRFELCSVCNNGHIKGLSHRTCLFEKFFWFGHYYLDKKLKNCYFCEGIATNNAQVRKTHKTTKIFHSKKISVVIRPRVQATNVL